VVARVKVYQTQRVIAENGGGTVAEASRSR
jgi:hypothetical protein